MKPSLTNAQLTNILCIMEKMLIEAKCANWQSLNSLDSERRVIIETCDDAESGSNIQASLNSKELSQKILSLDSEINRVVVEAKDNLLKENRHQTDQFKAMKGYARASLDYS